jgi:quinol monooxygenase YgiN
MITKAIYVQLKAKPGKEVDVEEFLVNALPLVEEEPGTTAWFALQEDIGVFSIFDVFADDDARNAHLAGKVATALMEGAAELLLEEPVINMIDVIASKMPK